MHNEDNIFFSKNRTDSAPVEPKKRMDFEEPVLSQVEDLTLQLALANRKLKESEQARIEMLSNISHDLRAPITAIRSSIDYLNTFTDDSMPDFEQLHSILKLMDIRSQTLETLIQNLYYLTSMDRPDSEFRFQTMDVVPLLEEYYFSAELDNKYDARHLYLDMPQSCSATVSIDPQRIIRVLDNLFTNALKYSTSGCEIRLNATRTPSNLLPARLDSGESNQMEHGSSALHDFVCISVTDTGIGIPADCIDKVFDRSYTVSSARTPDTPTGSGLGLAIVKKIIEQHGGQVWCESKEGRGSVFCFALPVIM